MSIETKKIKWSIIKRTDDVQEGQYLIPLDMRYLPRSYRPYLKKYEKYRIIKVNSSMSVLNNEKFKFSIIIAAEHEQTLQFSFPIEGFYLYISEDEEFLKNLFTGG